MDFLKQIALFERKLDCRLCFHDFSGELTALAGRETLPLHHTNPYCEAVRSFSPERYAECLKCDTGRVFELLRNGFPFSKKCHAGFLEYVFPLFKFRRLAGAMFLGIFRSGKKPNGFRRSALPRERRRKRNCSFSGNSSRTPSGGNWSVCPKTVRGANAENRFISGLYIISAIRKFRSGILQQTSDSRNRAPDSFCGKMTARLSRNACADTGCSARKKFCSIPNFR